MEVKNKKSLKEGLQCKKNDLRFLMLNKRKGPQGAGLS